MSRRALAPEHRIVGNTRITQSYMIPADQTASARTRPLFARVPQAPSTDERGRLLVQFLTARGPVVVFKHSPACFVSKRAMTEVRAFVAERPEVAVILVDVLDERGLARWISDHWEIRHESPQAIVFHAGVPTWHGSHAHVEAARLETETPPER